MRRIKHPLTSSDIQLIATLPDFLKTGRAEKFMNRMIRRSMLMMNYIQAPLLKLFKYFGGGIGRLLGIGTPENAVVRLKETLITFQDGAKSPTDVYLPKDVFENKSKAPTVLVRLPYWKNALAILGYLFASKGYVCVLQDMRGTASANQYGTMGVTFFVRPDGLETLKWITKRFWYNGKIGMWGISFLALTQLSIAWDNGGLLTCLFPCQCCFQNIIKHPGGLTPLVTALFIYSLFLTITQNENPNMGDMLMDQDGICDTLYHNPLASLYNDPIDDSGRYLIDIAEMAKIRDVEKLTSIINERFDLNAKFNEKDTGDNLKKFMRKVIIERRGKLTSDALPYGFGFTGEKMDTPMYWVGSWYDFLTSTELFEDVKRIQKNSPESFKKNIKIIMTPGAHGGLDFMPLGASFPPKGIPMKQMMAMYQNFMRMDWFECWLKDNPKQIDVSKIPPIRLWIMNKGIWRNFSEWPPRTKEMTWYIHSNGSANSRFGDGTFTTATPQTESPDEYDFNPANPVLTRGGRFVYIKSGRVNQIKNEGRKDILVYTSEKLEQGMEIIGEPKFVLYASSSAKDTDFMVKLVEVFNNRKALNIIDSGVRARFRNGFDKSAALNPNEVYKYEISLGATGIYIPKGHSLRIEITSSNFPCFTVNSNLAGKQNKKGFIIANQNILHDSQYPSHLILPVFKRY
ncbi:MAG: CocE/NonD family hydrolase [Candidatus Helarchaeota archaeon]|nr:CocE/NonD family hydrolase [Candidatus Helarchaeota archaeon]